MATISSSPVPVIVAGGFMPPVGTMTCVATRASDAPAHGWNLIRGRVTLRGPQEATGDPPRPSSCQSRGNQRSPRLENAPSDDKHQADGLSDEPLNCCMADLPVRIVRRGFEVGTE